MVPCVVNMPGSVEDNFIGAFPLENGCYKSDLIRAVYSLATMFYTQGLV